MKADTLTLRQVFGSNIRYVVPMFQRPYVWNRTKHWQPLWDDVCDTALRYIAIVEASETISAAQAAEQTVPHFLGAVVVDQIPTDVRNIDARQLIDGQQRMTTLQVMLDACQEVMAQRGLVKDAMLLSKLILNDEDLCDNPDHRFKVWPTTIDQDAFRASMDDDLDANPHRESAIADAHRFFAKACDEWLNDGDDIADRCAALTVAVNGLFQMVVIDLEPHDNAQVIFETLNARGTPLLAADLVKNHVLQLALDRGLNAAALYHDHWEVFDQPYWRKDVNQGRLTRPRVDLFFDYWLESRSTELVSAHDVFPVFRKVIREEPDLVAMAAELLRAGATYRDLQERRDHSRLGTFLYRWEVLEQQSLTPLLLWLFDEKNDIPDAQRELATGALESFLVRRTLLGAETKAYNRFFLELIRAVRDAEPSTAGQFIADFLASQTAEASSWPHDEEVVRALLTRPLYKKLTRARLRVVLEAIEDHLRSAKTEDQHVTRGSLTIEHLLPQGWTEELWPLPGEADVMTETLRRNELLHSIGNLTLVTNRLNPALSNGAWSAKRPKIEEHGVLRLHHGFRNAEVWDETHIVERSKELAAVVLEIWPRESSRPFDLDAVAMGAVADLDQAQREAAAPPLLWLLDEGILEPGELLVDETPDHRFEATIDDDGMVVIATGERFSSPSAASKQLHGGQRNGWWYWRVPRLDNKRLRRIRDDASAPDSAGDDQSDGARLYEKDAEVST